MIDRYVKTSRGIIFNEKKDAIISIKRTKYKEGKVVDIYYTFPGGHVEKGESFKETLVREIKEELDIEINIISEVSHIINDNIKREEKFFLCEKTSGNIHEGNGPEFTNVDYSKYGRFEITEIKLNQIEKYKLLPIEIRDVIKKIKV